MVELALVLPLLLLLIFGIIDFSYYIYGWSTVQFAVYRGAQQAVSLPPQNLRATYTDAEIAADACLQAIYNRAKAGTVGFTPQNNEFSFRWLRINGMTPTNMLASTPSVSRNTIIVPNTMVELRILRQVRPLTPLAQTVFGGQNFVFEAKARRTILNIDVGPGNSACT